MSSDSLGPVRRRQLVWLCFGLALAWIAWITWEAFQAASAQRRTVEAVLLGYARLGAELYARNVESALDYGWAYPVLRLSTGGTGNSFDPETLVRTPYGSLPLSDLARSFFSLDPRPSTADDDSQLPVGAVEEVLADPARRATFTDFAAQLETNDWPNALLFWESEAKSKVAGDAEGEAAPRMFFVTLEPTTGHPTNLDDAAPALRGFEGESKMFPLLLAGERQRNPALPESLTDGTDSRKLLAVSILTPHGREIFSDGPVSTAFHAQTDLGPRFGNVRVRAGIPREAAGHLVLGGLPYSRAPVLVVLFLMATGTLAATLSLMRRERELVRLRERFVMGASHELRTPLAQIRMFAETLRLGRVRSPGERARYLEAMDRETRRLALLVDNLLEFSREKKPEARLLPTAVGDFLRGVADDFSLLARERGAVVEVRADPGLSVQVDRDFFRQVLLNLLDNAIKHGANTQVSAAGNSAQQGAERHRISLLARPVDATPAGRWGDLVEITVSDRGPGVAPEHRHRIWDRFWRAPGVSTTGSGIGLAVVKELVNLQGGTVEVRANEDGGHGACFVILLPAAVATGQQSKEH